jgi:hypothetical protein
MQNPKSQKQMGGVLLTKSIARHLSMVAKRHKEDIRWDYAILVSNNTTAYTARVNLPSPLLKDITRRGFSHQVTSSGSDGVLG